MEPNLETNYYKRFRVLLRQNKLREALADLTAAVRLKPDYESALVQKIKLSIKLGKCADSVVDIQSLRKISPTHKELTLQTDAHACVNAMDEADRRMDSHRYAEAREFYNQALRYTESAAHVFIARAWCNLRLGDWYETVADTGKALKIEGDNLEALELRGRAYYVLGEFEMAMNHYRKGLQLDPEHAGIKELYRTLKKLQTFQTKATAAQSGKDWAAAVKNWLGMIAVSASEPGQYALLGGLVQVVAPEKPRCHQPVYTCAVVTAVLDATSAPST